MQVIPLKKMREACNFHHRYTSTMRDKIRKKNPDNHIVGFLKNLFIDYIYIYNIYLFIKPSETFLFTNKSV